MDLLALVGPKSQADPVVPGLKIVRRIGVGGQGIVYEAIRERPQQVVAVKVPLLNRHPEDRIERLRREAEVLANLNHPNIVKVLEVTNGEVDGRLVPCVVMELVEGARSITEYAKATGLNQRDRIELMIKVADAVQHMHERLRRYHRDLKPGNILVGRDGEPKVIDVGMAVTGDTRDRLNERGWIVGTIDYMAPEQFERDTAFLTQRTDVYSLGLILYELLTGALPYKLDGLSQDQRETAIRTISPRKLTDLCEPEFPGLAGVLEVCLRKESSHRRRDQRWDTPSAFARQLERVLAGHAAGSPGARRGRTLASAAAVVAVAAFSGWQWGVPIAEVTEAKGRFECSVFRTLPPPLEHATLDRTAVVGFQSTQEVAEVAARLAEAGTPIPDLDLNTPKTWRPIYPFLLEALQGIGTAAVTFDIVLKGDTEVDRHFYKVADSMDFPITVGLDLGPKEDRSESPNPTILNLPVREAGVSAWYGDDSAWWSDLLLQRGTQSARPMLPLGTVAAIQHRKGTHKFSTSDWAHKILIDADLTDPKATSVVYSDPTTHVWSTAVSTLGEQSEADTHQFGTRKGDRMTQLMLAVPGREALKAVTHSIRDVLTAPASTKKLWFSGRAVFVANMTGVGKDPEGHPDGRRLWAAYGNAVACEALLTNKGVHAPADYYLLGLVLACASAPLLVVRTSIRGRVAFTVVTLAAAAAIIALIGVTSWWVLRHWLWYVPAYAPAGAVIVSAGLAIAMNLVGWWAPARPAVAGKELA